MKLLRILVTKRLDDSFPGWVEFTIRGANGETFRFVDKDSVVSAVEMQSFPIETTIACTVLSVAIQPDGSKLFEVDTSPWGIESDMGTSRFMVNESQLVDAQGAA